MAEQVNYYSRFRFKVEIDGIPRAGFQKVEGLEQSVEVNVHRESNSILPHKSPGLFETEDLTLEFGATNDKEIWDWFMLAVDPESGQVAKDGYKKDISIVQLDDQGNEVERWNVFGAWPFRFRPGEWDATSGEKTIRRLQLAYDYFKRA